MNCSRKYKLLSVAIVFLSLAPCAPALARKAPPPPVVGVVQVSVRDISTKVRYVGRVVAVDKVDLVARVSGWLLSRNFVEGQKVKKGDVLFKIEPNQYENTVAQDRASLASAQATLYNAQAERKRSAALQARRFQSRQAYDKAVAAQRTASASVQQATAALKSAKLNLSYTTVIAPIDGIIGRATYTKGNFISPSSKVLATIVKEDPIYVVMQVASDKLLELRKKGALDIKNPPVVPRIILPGGSFYKFPGAFDFIDNQVSNTTATIAVRAKFPNPNGLLVDGDFVTLQVAPKHGTMGIVIPQTAVQENSKGFYVYVVNAKSMAVIRPIVPLHQLTNGMWAIKSGLKKGEKVIVQGIQKVRPNTPVTAKSQPAGKKKS